MEGDASSTRVVLVVDDNAFNRQGLVLYLVSKGYRTVEAGDEATAAALAAADPPVAAVVDIVIPPTPDGRALTGHSVGLQLVRRLKTINPAMGIVIFSAYEDRGSEIWEFVHEGMRGVAYLLKGESPDRLLRALKDTEAGHVVLDIGSVTNTRRLVQEMRARLSADEQPWVERAVRLLPTLTEREWEVTRRLASSHNNVGIAEAMGITPKTVENHIGRIYDKLGLSAVDNHAPQLRKVVLLAKACMIYEFSGGSGEAW